MIGSMHPNVARVVDAAREAGLQIEVERFPEGTRTAADAARAVGCDVAQIVKSLVFMADVGATDARRADGDEARAATGFAIGGVPPFGHSASVSVVVDRDLATHEWLWAAAGLPDAVFRISSSDLLRVSGGTVADLAEVAPG
jgi:prolyl-tRNA editing enzyme YbaK/EbsC (Cys-tRNA(Pro) deacylase)